MKGNLKRIKNFYYRLICKRKYKFLIIFFFIINNFILQKKYIFCFECIKNDKYQSSKCCECPNELIFNGLKIESPEDTIQEIIKYNKSISRFGDGEYDIIFGSDINYQEYNERLSKRLMEIINSNKTNLLVGIICPYNKSLQNNYINSEIKFWKIWFLTYKIKLLKILNKKKKYYSSEITRFYSKFKSKTKVPQYIEKLKKIWMGRDVLFVEGEKTRLGVGNDLFNNTKSIRRIICPPKNSFRVYDKILDTVLKFDKNFLILISLGPTASVLAYDLSSYGYQAVDIGHADIQYELFLRRAKSIIQIPFKFVNEYNSGKNENVGKVKDLNYYKQIAYKIF